MNAKLLAVLLAALVAGSLWFALAPTTSPAPVAATADPVVDTTSAPATPAAPVVTAQARALRRAPAMTRGAPPPSRSRPWLELATCWCAAASSTRPALRAPASRSC
jgi:hypothetical protein